MLETTKKKLDALYAGGRHPGTDGQLHPINAITRIDREEGEAIARLHRTMRPALSVEIGLAYGFSTLHILDAMAEGDYGHHIAIDPGADSFWHGIGLQAVRDAGLERRFEWIKAISAEALATLRASGRRAQFVFIDGSHLFDHALIDFSLSDQVLEVGGVILLDDVWMPAIRRLVAYIARNMRWYERLDAIGHPGLAGFTKVGRDSRRWNHFEDF